MTRNIAIAAAVLLGTVSWANAQGTMGHSAAGGSPGASQLSPGHQMRNGGDADDRGPGASGYSPGHEMRGHGTVGQSRGGRNFDRNGRQSLDHNGDNHRTIGQSRSGHDMDRGDLGRGDRDRGASEYSPGSRMHEGNDLNRR
ncbi:MAG: hypothetical protein KGJ00_10850 [Bradyrhizobium sp.]|nr:hypothetical protein [Bradyrhizobium sp.]